jgi:Ca2+/Na+ antiporter
MQRQVTLVLFLVGLLFTSALWDEGEASYPLVTVEDNGDEFIEPGESVSDAVQTIPKVKLNVNSHTYKRSERKKEKEKKQPSGFNTRRRSDETSHGYNTRESSVDISRAGFGNPPSHHAHTKRDGEMSQNLRSSNTNDTSACSNGTQSNNGTNNCTASSSSPCDSGSISDADDQCAFVSAHCPQYSILDYLHFYYCTAANVKPLSLTLFIVWILTLLFSLGFVADQYLVGYLIELSNTLKIPSHAAGMTIIAFGNGSPDLFSSVQAIQQKSLNLALGALSGAGVFDITMTLSLVLLVSPKPASVEFVPFLRDTLCYFLVILAVSLICNSGNIYIWEAGLLLAFYWSLVLITLTIVYVRKWRMNERKTAKSQQIERSSSSKEEEENGNDQRKTASENEEKDEKEENEENEENEEEKEKDENEEEEQKEEEENNKKSEGRDESQTASYKKKKEKGEKEKEKEKENEKVERKQREETKETQNSLTKGRRVIGCLLRVLDILLFIKTGKEEEAKEKDENEDEAKEGKLKPGYWKIFLGWIISKIAILLGVPLLLLSFS